VKNPFQTITLLWLLLTLGILGCSEKESTEGGNAALLPADLLPASNEISGWTKGTGAGDYGEAENQSELYDLIDGAAELYVDHGFEQGVLQNYYGNVSGTSSTVELFIADMGDSANAAALFEEPEVIPNGLIPWDAGDESYIDDNALQYIYLHVRQDQFYTRVRIDKGSDQPTALNVAQLFAQFVLNQIG
jgi:hypothetical protein